MNDRHYNGQRKRDKNTNKQGFSKHCTEKFEDTKGLIRKKIEGQTIQWPKEKGQTGQAMNYNTPHRKPKTEQHES